MKEVESLKFKISTPVEAKAAAWLKKLLKQKITAYRVWTSRRRESRTWWIIATATNLTHVKYLLDRGFEEGMQDLHSIANS